jgi:TnpA family transposase
MVDTRGEKEAVLPFEALFVCRIAPGLTVAGDQIDGVRDTGDAATLLDNANLIHVR